MSGSPDRAAARAGAVSNAGARRVRVVREPARLDRLAWIHRREARSIAEELQAAGYAVRLIEADSPREVAPDAASPPLLRVSDPVMLRFAQGLDAASVRYLGPSAAAMARCYDKYEACRIVAGAGIDGPATWLAREAGSVPPPWVLKPRRGSDSIGVRILRRGPVPARARTDAFLVQERIVGTELTVAVLGEWVGMPLRIDLTEGAVYSFARKYLWRPGRGPVSDRRLADRVREGARRIAAALAVDWAARIDLIYETASGRLRFLECDVAPLVGARSAFAASLEAAGIGRAAQLEGLLRQAGSVLHDHRHR